MTIADRHKYYGIFGSVSALSLYDVFGGFSSPWDENDFEKLVQQINVGILA